ncbi:MAG: helix-turn-helix domain-containing protein [Planctomycetes bacterium]|nr:helix-turn-helix domain-containing protein [Planctomycetota bacterium]
MTKYYTTSQVAKICNVHRNTIIGAIRRGILRIHRTPGGHARISQEDLDDFCQTRSLPADVVVPRSNRVLFVGEDPMLAQHASGLGAAGYEARTVSNGFDAGFEVAYFRPDVVVLDMALKDVPSEAIVKRIRETPATRDVLIVGFSAPVDEATILRYRDGGLDEYLPQPLDVATILGRIVEMIGPITSSNGTERPTMRLRRHSARLTRRAPLLRG